MTAEVWRPHPDWPQYEVSDRGGVRSVTRLDTAGRLILGRTLRFGYHRDGYPQVSLCGGGRRRQANVHALVMETFVGPRPDGLVCRHLDGDPTNNNLSNLSWGTPRENAEDRRRHGRARPPSRPAPMPAADSCSESA